MTLGIPSAQLNMSTVQEAASLFGSGLDEGSDPFGSVANPSPNSTQGSSPFPPPPPTSSTNTSVRERITASSTHDHQPADDLFCGAPTETTDDLFGAGGLSDSNWLGTGVDTGGAQDGYSDSSNAGPSGVTGQGQGWVGYEHVQQDQHYQAYPNSECSTSSTIVILLLSAFSIP